MSRYMQTLTCRFHPNATLIEDSRAGDMICPLCGLVVGERMIDVSAEWREFGNETAPKFTGRVGAAQNLLYDNDNLDTTISVGTGAGAVDEFGRQRYNKKISQKITDRAFLIFKYCYENKCLRGRSHDAIIASSIYIACRKEGSPRTIKEICGISTVSAKELGRTFKKIKECLPNSSAPQSIEIKDLVPRFCNRLNLNQDQLIRKTAIHIVERATEICNIQGRAPTSIVAASIYLACLATSEKKTKKDIQAAIDVSESVIRDIYKIMLPHAAKLFPVDFVFKCPLINLPTV